MFAPLSNDVSGMKASSTLFSILRMNIREVPLYRDQKVRANCPLHTNSPHQSGRCDGGVLCIVQVACHSLWARQRRLTSSPHTIRWRVVDLLPIGDEKENLTGYVNAPRAGRRTAYRGTQNLLIYLCSNRTSPRECLHKLSPKTGCTFPAHGCGGRLKCVRHSPHGTAP